MYPQNTCQESDWKLFRKRVPVWQERYMGRLIKEYRSILESEKLSSEKFWALEKQIRQDQKSPGVVVDMRRSTMQLELMQMLYSPAGAVSLSLALSTIFLHYKCQAIT